MQNKTTQDNLFPVTYLSTPVAFLNSVDQLISSVSTVFNVAIPAAGIITDSTNDVNADIITGFFNSYNIKLMK